ncbi:MAG: 4Fe-4S dicluster domain-containing protein [Spirochaetaceae bacterium]
MDNKEVKNRKLSFDRWNLSFETFKLPILFIFIFYGVAFWRYFATGKIFYIYNFVYIGTSISLGIFLSTAMPKKYATFGRRLTQLLVGVYLLGYVGIIKSENLQIEGFFFYLLAGVFAGSTLHYVIAKILGTAIFNRGWCSWACWTAMVLDFLPWKKSPGRIKKVGILRYVHFFSSLLIVLYFWFVIKQRDIYSRSITEFYWLAIGNIAYYLVSILMAFVLKDNRAFCKYLCPIPVFQTLLSGFSLLKVEIDSNKCTECGLCEKNCPMDIQLLEYKRNNKRITSTECIICNTCENVCSFNAVNLTFKLDKGPNLLRYVKPRD